MCEISISRSLKVLFLEESYIIDEGDAWLHELSLHNSSLEVLNITGTDLKNINVADLSVLATNCKSLVSLKLNELEIEELSEVLNRTMSLKELGGVSVGDSGPASHPRLTISLPATVTSLVGLYYFGANEGDEIVNSLVQPIAPGLRKIDLQYACLSIDAHCQLLGRCANLEALEVNQ
jgi:coronatine-insensitive protein 1